MVNNVLFAHDGHVFRDDAGEYYGIHINNALVERYKLLGDNVALAVRIKKIKDGDTFNYTKFLDHNITIIDTPNTKSFFNFILNRNKANIVIRNAVEKADIVVARIPSVAGAMAIRNARRLNKPYLVEMVACTYDAYWNYNWKGKLIAHYKYYVTKNIVKDCPYVMYVTKKFLQERYPCNGYSIDVSDVELVHQPRHIIDDRLNHIARLNKNSPIILGTVAAIDVPYKGQIDVIKALSLLKKSGTVFHYHIIGQGDPSRLNTYISKYGMENEIKIVGALKHSEVFEYLKGIDLYVQPSKQEGLPRALIEAMSVAVPAIGSRVGGIPELLDDEFIFEAGNHNEIAHILSKITPEMMAAMATKNFTKSEEYNKTALFNKRVEFYKRIIRGVK